MQARVRRHIADHAHAAAMRPGIRLATVRRAANQHTTNDTLLYATHNASFSSSMSHTRTSSIPFSSLPRRWQSSSSGAAPAAAAAQPTPIPIPTPTPTGAFKLNLPTPTPTGSTFTNLKLPPIGGAAPSSLFGGFAPSKPAGAPAVGSLLSPTGPFSTAPANSTPGLGVAPPTSFSLPPNGAAPSPLNAFFKLPTAKATADTTGSLLQGLPQKQTDTTASGNMQTGEINIPGAFPTSMGIPFGGATAPVSGSDLFAQMAAAPPIASGGLKFGGFSSPAADGALKAGSLSSPGAIPTTGLFDANQGGKPLSFEDILAQSRKNKEIIEDANVKRVHDADNGETRYMKAHPSLSRRVGPPTSGARDSTEAYRERARAQSQAQQEEQRRAEELREREEAARKSQEEKELRARIAAMSPDEKAEWDEQQRLIAREERRARIAAFDARQAQLKEETAGMSAQERDDHIAVNLGRAKSQAVQYETASAHPDTFHIPNQVPLYLQPLEGRIAYMKQLLSEIHMEQSRMHRRSLAFQKQFTKMDEQRQAYMSQSVQKANEQQALMSRRKVEFDMENQVLERGAKKLRLLLDELHESLKLSDRFNEKNRQSGSTSLHFEGVGQWDEELQLLDGRKYALDEQSRMVLHEAEQRSTRESQVMQRKYPDMTPSMWWDLIQRELENAHLTQIDALSREANSAELVDDVTLKQGQELLKLQQAQKEQEKLARGDSEEKQVEEDEEVEEEEEEEAEEEEDEYVDEFDRDNEGDDRMDEFDEVDYGEMPETRRPAPSSSLSRVAARDDVDDWGSTSVGSSTFSSSISLSERETPVAPVSSDTSMLDQLQEEQEQQGEAYVEDAPEFSGYVASAARSKISRLADIKVAKRKEVVVFHVQTMSSIAHQMGVPVKSLNAKLRELDLSVEKGSQSIVREDAARLLIEEFGYTPVSGEQIVQPQVTASLRRKAMKAEEYLALPHRPAVITVMGHVDHGKCWSRGTKLMMYSGRACAVEDIREGDLLMGDDGQPRLVQPGSIHRGHTGLDEPSPYRQPAMYTITPARPSSNGRATWSCNNDHILVLKFPQPPTSVRQVDEETWSFESFELIESTNSVTHRPYTFSSLSAAHVGRSSYLSKWSPLIWECSVDEYLASSELVQAHAHMYQPSNPIQFQPSAHTFERALEHAAQRTVTETELTEMAWACGAWIVIGHDGGAFDFTHLPSTDASLSLITRLTALDRTLNLSSTLPHLLTSYTGLSSKSTLPYEFLGESIAIRQALIDGLTAASAIACATIDQRDATPIIVAPPMQEGVTHLCRSMGLQTRINEQIIFVNHPTDSNKNMSLDHCDSFTITRAPHDDYFGFTVSGNGRLLLNDFVVTHNTSLLDRLRRENRAGGEAGGITQSIGAFKVDLQTAEEVAEADANEDSGALVPVDEDAIPTFATFLDTPGHAAFKSMRAKGCSSSCTDMVILVISAADGLQPQSLEVIQLARQNNVPLIIAVNKIDLPGADPEAILQQLQVHDVVVESLGGEVLSCNISAKTGEGMQELKELIRLTSEVLQLHADRACAGEAYVLESRVVKSGCIANVLVRNGSIKVGQYFVCGLQYGKIRTLHDENDRSLTGPVLPGSAAQLTGFKSLEDITEDLYIVDSEEQAQAIVADRQELLGLDESELISQQQHQMQLDQKAHAYKIQVTRRKKRVAIRPLTEEEKAIQGLQDNSVPVLIKADVSGSMEVLLDYFSKLPRDEVLCSILKSSLGEITAADVEYASEVGGSGTSIFGFNVKASSEAILLAKQKDIRIFTHAVIYSLWDDVRTLLSAKLPAEMDELSLGQAEVLQLFPMSGKKKKADVAAEAAAAAQAAAAGLPPPAPEGPPMVAGCRVKNGKIDAKMKFKIIRDEEVIFDGGCVSLRVNRDIQPFVNKGGECGIRLSSGSDALVAVGDTIECYTMVRKERFIDDSAGRGFVANDAGMYGDAASYA